MKMRRKGHGSITCKGQHLSGMENCTVIHCVTISVKFGNCTGVVLNGTHDEPKIRLFKCPKCVFLASPSVPFRPTMVQVPNLALIEIKPITVCADYQRLVKVHQRLQITFKGTIGHEI
jgi:hypothetical protein